MGTSVNYVLARAFGVRNLFICSLKNMFIIPYILVVRRTIVLVLRDIRNSCILVKTLIAYKYRGIFMSIIGR